MHMLKMTHHKLLYFDLIIFSPVVTNVTFIHKSDQF